MPFYLKKGDLVASNVDAIVNASNVNLKMVEGVGRAIFHKAGDAELGRACKAIGRCNVGKAVLTPSFNMTNCKGIIHAVAPIYINGKHNEEKLLRSAYRESLKICVDNGFKSVAFPLLSGEFNYPLSEAYEVAQDEFLNFLKDHDDFEIYLVIFKNFPDLLDEKDHADLKSYIINQFDTKIQDNPSLTNDDFVKILKEFIIKKGLTENQLLQLSNLRKGDFENLFKVNAFVPSKNLALSLAIGLKLDESETSILLSAAGYKTCRNSVVALVSLFFIKKRIYDVYTINRALFNYEAKPLGLQ